LKIKKLKNEKMKNKKYTNEILSTWILQLDGKNICRVYRVLRTPIMTQGVF